MDRKAPQTEGTGQCGHVPTGKHDTDTEPRRGAGPACSSAWEPASRQPPVPACGEAALFNASVPSPLSLPDEKASAHAVPALPTSLALHVSAQPGTQLCGLSTSTLSTPQERKLRHGKVESWREGSSQGLRASSSQQGCPGRQG